MPSAPPNVIHWADGGITISQDKVGGFREVNVRPVENFQGVRGLNISVTHRYMDGDGVKDKTSGVTLDYENAALLISGALRSLQKLIDTDERYSE